MKKIIIIITSILMLLYFYHLYHNYSIKNQYVGFYYGENLKDTLFIINSNGTGYSYKGFNTPDVIMPIGRFTWYINTQSKYNAIIINWSGLTTIQQMKISQLISSVTLGSNLNVKDNFSNKLFFTYRDKKAQHFKLGICGTKKND